MRPVSSRIDNRKLTAYNSYHGQPGTGQFRTAKAGRGGTRLQPFNYCDCDGGGDWGRAGSCVPDATAGEGREAGLALCLQREALRFQDERGGEFHWAYRQLHRWKCDELWQQDRDPCCGGGHVQRRDGAGRAAGTRNAATGDSDEWGVPGAGRPERFSAGPWADSAVSADVRQHLGAVEPKLSRDARDGCDGEIAAAVFHFLVWNLARSGHVYNGMRATRFAFAAISLSACLIVGQATGGSGRIIAVDGRQVHVSVAGQGMPTVIFEAGFVKDLGSWAKVQPEIAKSCATFSYDRAGIGQSQETSLPRTGEQIAKDLHALLRQLGVMPPYVLVGHSAGGLYIRSFARQYPDEVRGVVFVAAGLPEYLRWLRAHDVEHWQELVRIGTESGDVVRAQWLGLEPTLKEVEESGPLPRVPVEILVS